MSLLAVDIDDSIAHLIRHWVSLYNLDYDDNLTEEDMHCWEIETLVKPECGLKIFKYLDDPDLYNDVLPVEGALEGIEQLREDGHRIVFATSCAIDHGGKKFNWLVNHGFFYGVDKPKKDYVEIRDKSLLHADYLIDDYTGNLANFSGIGILMNRPHNRTSAWYPRYSNWEDIVSYIRRKEEQKRDSDNRERLHIGG